VLTSAATNAPRFDYNPSTLAAQGLLIEEPRTNSIRNNTMVGAVAGTPGTSPTNWSINFNTVTGLSSSVVGTGTENGITYIDIRINGTPSASILQGVQILFDTNTGIAASASQTWTESLYLRVVAGSTANIPNFRINIQQFNATVFVLSNSTVIANPTSTQTRFVATSTFSASTTTHALPLLALETTSGAAIDITLRIGLPQLEQGAFATSVIPTTTTALTRAADVALVNTLSPWYNASTGTIYAEFALTQPVSGQNQFLARFSDNSYNNSIVDNVISTGFSQLATASGGVFDGAASTAVAVSANTTTKFAGAYAANDLAACKDGGTVAVDPSATIPSGLTRFDLGSDHAGANRVKAGYLRRITYYPRRLSNAELQAITT
jgi:hypothetical protein